VGHRARQYLIAVAALAAAILVRWLLDPVIGDSLPLVTLFGAVAAAVWVGGALPAAVAAILGYLACAYLFIPPRFEFVFDVPSVVGLAAYLFTCSLIIAIGEAMRRARARARERSDLLRITLASIGDAMITTDNAGRVTYLNAVAESLTGWTQEDAKGQPLDTVFRALDEQTRKPIESPATRALREGTVVGLANHTVLVGRDGAERPVDDSAAPIRDELGRVSGCVLIFRDVSERRRLEKAVAARFLEARLLASIVESSDDAIVRKSLDSVIQSWNAGAERVFGYTADEAVGRHISIVIPPDRLAEEDRIIATLKEGRRVEPFETERVRKDGRRIRVSVTISPIKDEAGNVVAASKIARDVTKQRQAEAEREMFATLIENSTDFIGIADLDAVPIFVNRAGLALVGLDDMDAARKLHVRDFFFPEDQARILDEFFPSVAEKGHGAVDVRFRNFKTGDGRWMAYKVLKLIDDKGQVLGFATVSQDITERRRLEDGLRQLAANLSEEGRRKNEFLATLAHELRNPLAALSNMLEILRRSGPGQAAPPAQAVDGMGRQLSQLVRLVDDLLDLSRITHNRLELRKGPVELGAVIDQAVESSRPLVESMRHELRVVPSPEPIALEGDAARLAQVFGNLLNNSAKYTSPGGKIEVKTERHGKEAVVTVKDNGAGIPPDRLDSIFEMFNQVQGSLERSQGGLGIGLTLVRRLVQMHGGSVQAESAGEGKGAEFVVRLPIHEPLPAASPAPAREPSAARRILVVDDNHDAAESLAMLLNITGNKTSTAHDGADAFEAAARQRPDVVLLDIGLPTLNGYEVCRRIRDEPWGKEMVLIALTGWGQDEDRRKSHEAGFDGHLVKPVNYPALMALLDSLGVAK